MPAVRLSRMLEGLAAEAKGEGSSLYLAPGDSPDKAAMAATGWAPALAELGPAALRDGCGLVGLRAGGRGLLIAPPFPVDETCLVFGWEEGPLRRILDAEYTVGVVLVRLGRFSVAVFRGGELVESKTDSRYVKGKHHAGGTSQLRYTRIRDGADQAALRQGVRGSPGPPGATGGAARLPGTGRRAVHAERAAERVPGVGCSAADYVEPETEYPRPET